MQDLTLLPDAEINPVEISDNSFRRITGITGGTDRLCSLLHGTGIVTVSFLPSSAGFR